MGATDVDASERRDALVERYFAGMLGMIDVHALYVGDRLGLYRALAGAAATSEEVVHERFQADPPARVAVHRALQPGDRPRVPERAGGRHRPRRALDRGRARTWHGRASSPTA